MGQKIEISYVVKKVINNPVENKRTSTMPLKYIIDNDKNYVCPDCGKKCPSTKQSTMSMHMKTHEEQHNHICKICKKGFLQKQNLDLHIRSKHPELLKESIDDNKKFKCPFDNCEFSALTKGNCIIHCLRLHFQDEINIIMNKNNETKIICCNECQKEFSSSCAFYYHCKNCIEFNKNDDKYKKFEEICS